MDDKRYSIYKHTTPDGKVYIGITSMSPDKRWGCNGVNYNKQYFNNAIEEFGWNNIEHEIIATNVKRTYAECFEKALIKMYDSTNKNNGYNISEGGLDVEHDRYFMYFYDFKLELSPQYIIRFFLLCSYASYDTNFLRYGNGKYINSKSLKEILKLSYTSCKDFIKEITNKGYLIKESRRYRINDSIISKGKIYPGRNYIKIYSESYIALYNSINSRQHKMLGYFISEIKKLNIKYNILCGNIHEVNLNSIDIISAKYVFKKFNLSIENLNRIKKELNELKFNIKDENQNVIKISNDNKTIIYNPNIFYNGNNTDRDLAYLFFKSDSSNN